MSGLWQVGRIAGTPIKVHWSAALLPVLAVAYAVYYDIGEDGVLWLQLFVLATLLSVLLHELGHAVAARYFGVPVHDIVLLAVGGAARLRRLPDSPRDEALVAFAGPLVNALLALAMLPALFLWPQEDWLPWLSNYTTRSFLATLGLFNAAVFAFNLIPVFPLDGGRLVRATLATGMTRLRATKAVSGITRVLALGALAYAVYEGSFLVGGFAIYAFLAAGREVRGARVRSFLDQRTVGEVALPVRVFDPETPLRDVRQQLIRNGQRGAVIADECSPIGFVTLEMLDAADDPDAPERHVGDLELLTVLCHDSDTPLRALTQQFSQHPASIAIEEIDHRPAGWADLSILEEAFGAPERAEE